MSRPTLSVLMPNYNHGHYIGENLDRILEQSRPPDEIVIVDDGSTDDSLRIIDHYARQDSRVRVYRNERNRGAVYTLNRALELARGDYIYGGAADDRMRPGFFEKSMNLLTQYPQAGLCFGYGTCFDTISGRESEYPIRLADTECFLPPEELALAWDSIAVPGHSVAVPGNSAIWKKQDFLRAGGYREDLRWHSDWFSLQVVALRHGCCFIPESVIYTRMDQSSYSGAGQSLWEYESVILDRILRLLKSPEFQDVLPLFQQGKLLSQFAPWMVRVIVERTEHWDRDSALLIENALLKMDSTFLFHANPQVRIGAATCLGELGPAARPSVGRLCQLLDESNEISEAARGAIRRIRGALPGNFEIARHKIIRALFQAPKTKLRPLRDLLAWVYRRINYKLYARIDRLEAGLAQLLIESSDRQRQLSEELAALQELALSTLRGSSIPKGLHDPEQERLSPQQTSDSAEMARFERNPARRPEAA
jgi:glycosyltransferase involved in cell wall biosynthesis